MNERIRELIEESKCLSDGYNTGAVDLEKFAELIVRACATVGFETVANGDLVEDSILTHFGVE